ncbi:hypothetical protein EDD86DRAFT_200362 [Gorgonomyces haynaldii]|nr:hypothetical protein EDD86DRAFT_200362 [Gorgonomyces haynaldii]
MSDIQLWNGVITSLTAGILLSQCIIYAKDVMTLKPARIALFVQFVLCFLRNVTVTILAIVPGISCLALTDFGLIVYAMWIIALQTVLYFRANAFITKELYRKIYLGFMVLLWAVLFGIRMYQVGNTFVRSKPEDLCFTGTSGVNMALTNFVLLIVTETALLIPFVYGIVDYYMRFSTISNNFDDKSWRYLCFSSTAITLTIIVIEFGARYIPPMYPVILKYAPIMFSLINLIEANLVVFMVEDLKQSIKKSMTTVLSSTKQSKGTGSSV